MHTAHVTRLARYPVKGLSADPLDHVTLHPGQGVPLDRAYGFARHGSGFDPNAPKPLPKDRFVVLLTQAALAGLATSFDPTTQTLVISGGGETHSFNTSTIEGQSAAARFLDDTLALNDPARPTFVSAHPHRFTDVSVVSPKMMNAISVLNLASVRAFEAKIGAPVDPARFRANIEIDGLPAFAEMEAVGATLTLGRVTLRILQRTKRCAATEVNPTTAERDLKLPYLLRRTYGHMDMGVYVEVVTGGDLSVGDTGDLARAD